MSDELDEMPAALTTRPPGYAEWLAELKARVQAAQQRAALSVKAARTASGLTRYTLFFGAHFSRNARILSATYLSLSMKESGVSESRNVPSVSSTKRCG